MKYSIITFLFCACGLTSIFDVTAQTSNSYIGLSAGKNFSTFLFTNSSNEKSDNIRFVTGTTLALNYQLNFSPKQLFITELMYQENGAQQIIDDIPLNWELNYVGLGLGYGFTVFEKSKYSLTPGLTIAADYLIGGSQTIAATRYEIKEINAFSNFNLRAMPFIRNQLKVSENLLLSFDYRLGYGLNQIEKNDKDVGQKTKNLSHHVLMNITIQL
jgi:hypothetical protein